MILSDAKYIVSRALGINESDTEIDTNLAMWLNRSYRDIAGKYTWNWLKSVERVVLTADYTTGTVSVTAGATTATFSATITASQTGKYIQFSGANDWYYISAHTAGTDTATISPAYAQSTDLSSGTFTIRQFYYSLSSSAEYAYSARLSTGPNYIRIIDSTRYDEHLPFTDATGEVTGVIFWGLDSSNNWQFTPYPFPDSAQIIEFRTIKRISSDLTNATAPIFPDRFTDIWLEGAKAYGYEFLDDAREDKCRGRFERRIAEEIGKDEVGLSKERILGANDQYGRADYIPFPSNYGKVE